MGRRGELRGGLDIVGALGGESWGGGARLGVNLGVCVWVSTACLPWEALGARGRALQGCTGAGVLRLRCCAHVSGGAAWEDAMKPARTAKEAGVMRNTIVILRGSEGVTGGAG